MQIVDPMKIRLSIFLILLFGFAAGAEIITSIGENNVFEREAFATQYSNRTPFALRFGYQEFSNSIFAEYNQFGANDSMAQMSISRTQHEVFAWVRHSFWSEDLFQLYFQCAPGLQLMHLRSRFLASDHEDTSRSYFALAAAAGAAIQINRYRFEMELRALSSEMAAPNPTLSVGIYGGYLF